MSEAGDLDQLGRGLYRLAELPPLVNPDFVSVAIRVPAGVICLISALSFHGLTTQIPHEIWLAAVEQKARRPKVTYPPVRVVFFTGACFREGMEVHRIMEQEIHI